MTWRRATNREELTAAFRDMLPHIIESAWDCGYAIGVHGTMRRDLDIIAMPWIDWAVDKDALAEQLQIAACGHWMSKYSWEKKPHGRVATSFYVVWCEFDYGKAGLGHCDLSVMPRSCDA